MGSCGKGRSWSDEGMRVGERDDEEVMSGSVVVVRRGCRGGAAVECLGRKNWCGEGKMEV